MKYDKTKEKNYNTWQNDSGDHKTYMLGLNIPTSEYYRIRKKALSYLEKGDSLLDVGCASGGTYHHIINYTKRKIEYKGVDYCEKFIEANKGSYPEAEFEVQDARYLKEDNNSWDVVLLYDVLDGLKGWKQAIDEAIRVCRKKVIIVMWMDPRMDLKLDYMEKKMKNVKAFDWQPVGTHYHYFIIGDKR